jgi:hypothetical protein
LAPQSVGPTERKNTCPNREAASTAFPRNCESWQTAPDTRVPNPDKKRNAVRNFSLYVDITQDISGGETPAFCELIPRGFQQGRRWPRQHRPASNSVSHLDASVTLSISMLLIRTR